MVFNKQDWSFKREIHDNSDFLDFKLFFINPTVHFCFSILISRFLKLGFLLDCGLAVVINRSREAAFSFQPFFLPALFLPAFFPSSLFFLSAFFSFQPLFLPHPFPTSLFSFGPFFLRDFFSFHFRPFFLPACGDGVKLSESLWNPYLNI